MNLNHDQRQQLARVLDYLYADEESDYAICEHYGEANVKNHIFDDIKALSDALGEFNKKESKGLPTWIVAGGMRYLGYLKGE